MADSCPPARLNAAIRERLSATSLAEFLKDRGMQGKKIITMSASASVADAMEVRAGGGGGEAGPHSLQALSTHNISSLPVVGQDSQFLGFCDVPFFLECFLKGNFLREPASTAPFAAPPLHTESPPALLAYPSRLPGDVPPPARFPMLTLIERLNQVGPDFAALPLSRISPGGELGADGELFTATPEATPLLAVAQALQTPSGGNINHRIAVRSSSSDGDIVDIISQSDLIRWVAARLGEPEFAPLGEASLERLRLSPKPVLCVHADTPALEAFQSMLNANVSIAGVKRDRPSTPDTPRPSLLVGALSMAETRGIVSGQLGSLALPTGEFLALRHGCVWSSMGEGGAESLTARDVGLQRRTLSTLPPGANLQELVTKLAMGAPAPRAIFVSDPATSAPLSVITPTDILRLITAEE